MPRFLRAGNQPTHDSGIRSKQEQSRGGGCAAMAISPLTIRVCDRSQSSLGGDPLLPLRLGATRPNCHPDQTDPTALRVPAILMNRTYSVYILSNSKQTLYTGVTSDLVGTLVVRRLGVGSRFTKRHRLHSLVWYESTNYVWSALEREKKIKSWKRKRKIALIESINPGWVDLSPALGLPLAVEG